MQFNLPLPATGPVTGSNLSASQFAAIAPSLSGVGSTGGSEVITPGIGKLLEAFGNGEQSTDKLGSLLGNLGAGADIASGLARIYLGFQANKLAKKNFNFQREAYANNLNDTRAAFNKALEDQAYARDAVQGTSNAGEYIKRHQLGGGAGS